MSVLLQPGTYDGTVKAATIYEAPSGAVMAQMQIEIEGHVLKGSICLVQKDGTLSERGFRDVQAIFGWSDWDWARWEVEPEEHAGAAVKAVLETVQGDRSEFTSIKYVNPPHAGQQLEKADAKSLAAKYGAKTRALFGGSPAKPAAPAAKPRPPAPTAKPAVPAVTSTMEECWDKFVEKNATMTEQELYDLWSKDVAVFTGKQQNDCGPADWGKMMLALSNNLPF